MSDTEYFSQEYQPESQTGIKETTIVKEVSKIEDCSTNDFEIYGISKPRRVIIKAKLTNGQD
ncbi:MAG: hypothetical protein WCI92_00430 [Bacteroidota bacterium]